MTNPYTEEYRQVAAEIRAILEKHDMALTEDYGNSYIYKKAVPPARQFTYLASLDLDTLEVDDW